MNNNHIIQRVNQSINGLITSPCAKGCPHNCCSPFISSTLISKSLLKYNDDFLLLKKVIKNEINQIQLIKSKDDKYCFRFKGCLLSDIKTNISHSEKKISQKHKNELGLDIPDYLYTSRILKEKKKISDNNFALVMVFNCLNYDFDSFNCGNYLNRPYVCRDYNCIQLEPEILNKDPKEITKQIILEKTKRDYAINNLRSNISEAINFYLQ